MKIKHELIKFVFCGDVHSFYIRKIKKTLVVSMAYSYGWVYTSKI